MREDDRAERYANLRDALMGSGVESTAALSWFRVQGDSGTWWLTTARSELCASLAGARLEQAKGLALAISKVNSLGDGEDGRGDGDIRRAVGATTAGIKLVVDRQFDRAIEVLRDIDLQQIKEPSLGWSICSWLAHALKEIGEIEEATVHCQRGLEFSKMLDRQAEATTLRQLGDLSFVSSNLSESRSYIQQAQELFSECQDHKGVSGCLLSIALIERAGGRSSEAIAAAEGALSVYPEWSDPLLFLIRQALIDRNLSLAETHLKRCHHGSVLPSSFEHEQAMIELAQSGRANSAVISKFTLLKESKDIEDMIVGLREIVEEYPEINVFRDHLAWQLYEAKRDGEAIEHFEKIIASGTDPELHSSALLGLGCLHDRQGSESSQGSGALDELSPLIGDDLTVSSEARVSAGSQPSFSSPPAGNAGIVEGSRDLELGQGGRDLGGEILKELTSDPDIDPSAYDTQPTQRISADSLYALIKAGDKPLGKVRIEKLDSGVFSANLSQQDPSQSLTDSLESPRGLSVGFQRRCSFFGGLEELGVSELLEFMKRSKQTGTVVVSSSFGIGKIGLYRGDIAYVIVPDGPHLEDEVMTSGICDPKTIEDVLELQKKSDMGPALASGLVDAGTVDSTRMRQIFTGQATRSLLKIICWEKGRFAFQRRERGAAAPSVTIDTTGVLLEASRILDESMRDRNVKAVS